MAALNNTQIAITVSNIAVVLGPAPPRNGMQPRTVKRKTMSAMIQGAADDSVQQNQADVRRGEGSTVPERLARTGSSQFHRPARTRRHRIGREVECGNPGAKHTMEFGAGTDDAKFRIEMRAGGGRRTRTFEAIRRLIYSQLPLPLGTLPRPSASGTDRPSGGGPDHG